MNAFSDLADQKKPSPLNRLRWEWAAYLLAAVGLAAIGSWTLSRALSIRQTLAWLAPVIGFGIYLFGTLWRRLDDNRLKGTGPAPLFPSLGPANGLTIVRAILTATLAGFLLIPWPGGRLAWAPGLLYLTAVVIDFLDGWVARLTGQTTRLGETLDMEWDSIAALTGITLAFLYGQAPAAYLLVGLARYLYLFGLWLHQRRGQSLRELPPNRFRRAMAGTHMGITAVILLPIYHSPVTQIAAGMFLVPFLASFFFDYLWVTGRVTTYPIEWFAAVKLRATLQNGLAAAGLYLPLVLRAALVVLLASLINVLPNIGGISGALLPVLMTAASLGLLLGAAGRVSALALLLLTGLTWQLAPFEWRFGMIFIFSMLVMMMGTGRFSLWTPEDWLIDHRAGE